MIVPITLEVVKNLWLTLNLLVLKKKRLEINLDFKPSVTILIPVYKSAKTIELCLNSLLDQTYGVENLQVFLLNNGPRDLSYEVFESFQRVNKGLRIWWIESSKGKSSALNKGIFNSTGKYIVNIDSDGWLEKSAIENIVKRFESDSSISSLTGVVLTDPIQIEETSNKVLRMLQRAEFVEYVESFLIGRNHESSSDSLYTLAGAFSCFRKEVVSKTQLYNPQTLGEDTHMTFQVRTFIGGKIQLCEDAILYVDPIESLDKLYSQRQRWQRSTMEIATMFKEYHLGTMFDFFKKPNMRLLIKDHTLAFLNLFWSFSCIYFFFIGYPLKYFILSHLILIAIYSCNSLLYALLARKFLKLVPSTETYLKKMWGISFLMVFYRLLTYLFRVSGLINSLTLDAKWVSLTLKEEVNLLKCDLINVVKRSA